MGDLFRHVLLKIKQAQKQRAETYGIWEGAFQQYLGDPVSEIAFQQACSKAQNELQAVNALVNEQTTSLQRSKEYDFWAKQFQKLQNLERQKLETTVNRIMTRWKCRHESTEEAKPIIENEDLQLRRKQAQIVDDINAILTEIDFELYDLADR